MTQVERSYLLNCILDPAKGAALAELRAAHLAHIVQHQADIIFGGVLGAADAPPEAICLVIRASSRDEVAAMARADPYAQAYAEVRISEFQQRIPEQYPGQLARARDAFAAGTDQSTGNRRS